MHVPEFFILNIFHMPIRMTDDPTESDDSGGGFEGGGRGGGGLVVADFLVYFL